MMFRALVTAFHIERRPIVATITTCGLLGAVSWLCYLGICMFIGGQGCPEGGEDSLRCMGWMVMASYGYMWLAGLSVLALSIGLVHQIWLVKTEFSTLNPLALGIQGLLYVFVETDTQKYKMADMAGSWIIGVPCVTVAAVYLCVRGSRKPALAGTEEERQPLVDVKHIL
jgi:hypothetical protein